MRQSLGFTPLRYVYSFRQSWRAHTAKEHFYHIIIDVYYNTLASAGGLFLTGSKGILGQQLCAIKLVHLYG